MDIFDQQGNRKDWAWLTATFGRMEFLDAGGATKFRLMRVDVTEGPANLKVRVLNEAGQPQVQQPVANHWPDNTLQLLGGGGLKSVWQPRASIQYTGSDGFTGYGLGGGSYIKDLAAGGAHTVWVLSPSLPSDGLAGIGMLGGTNHVGPLFLTFQIVAGGTGEPPVTPPITPPTIDMGPAIILLQNIDGNIQKLVTHLGVRNHG